MVRDFSSQASRIYRSINHKAIALPLFTCPVSAGFPSPADDYLEGQLDVATHNTNRLGPQSSQFWDQINCNYRVA